MIIARPLIYLLLFGGIASAESISVYDNLDGPQDGGGWWNADAETMVAQPFLLGNHDTINSVALRLRRIGEPDGTMYLNLYDDDGGRPGSLLGSLGTVDPRTVTQGRDGRAVFDTPVSGLTPEEVYHIVLSHDGTRWRDPSPRVFWSLTTQPGASGAGEALAKEPKFGVPDWHTVRNFPAGGPPFSVWFYAKIDAPPRGDFDRDGFFTTSDIDALTTRIVSGATYDEVFDLTIDNQIDHVDLETWLSNAGRYDSRSRSYQTGDTNLDGRVNATDLNNLALNWQQNSNAAWSGGDFTADGMVDVTDLNQLALHWRDFVPFSGAVPVAVGSDAYVQDFDEALGTDGSATRAELPIGWTVADNGRVSKTTMRSFPIGVGLSGSGAASFNAGVENDPDRTLAIGVNPAADDLALQMLAHTTASDAKSFQLQFDVEAWDAADGVFIGGARIAGADDPGEAAFQVTVEIDSGNGFTPLVDLGAVTTGPSLQWVRDGIVDGNAAANRIAFDSGLIPAAIPMDSKLSLSWAPDLDAETNGWVYGIDNVSLRLFTADATGPAASVPEPANLLVAVIGLVLLWTRRRR